MTFTSQTDEVALFLHGLYPACPVDPPPVCPGCGMTLYNRYIAECARRALERVCTEHAGEKA
jgi:pyruvate/2-oxoacid:ferredoxin oxidoreductase beta subunit